VPVIPRSARSVGVGTTGGVALGSNSARTVGTGVVPSTGF
jgi:hypothetical protein